MRRHVPKGQTPPTTRSKSNWTCVTYPPNPRGQGFGRWKQGHVVLTFFLLRRVFISVVMFVCLFLGAKCSTWFGSDDGSCFFALWLWQLLRPVRLLRNAHALGINRSCRPGIRYFLWNIYYIFLGGWGDGGGIPKAHVHLDFL
jgi:hypothetical protein